MNGLTIIGRAAALLLICGGATRPATGTMRANRGGSFGSSAANERSASRAGNPPMEASAYRGFRIALVVR